MMTKKVKAVCSVLALACFAFVTSACNRAKDGAAETEGPTGAIKARGVLKVGVKPDVPGFGLQNTATGQYEGFEIEIAKLFAQDIFDDPTKVQFTPVTAKTRGPLIDNGDVDMIIATFTITDERKLSYNFTTPYYVDAVGMLVLNTSGINSFSDCNGKIIGVSQSATSRAAIEQEASAIGITVSFQEYATYPEIKAALDSGRVNVFSVDKSILGGYLDSSSHILPDTFAPQPYGVVTKLSNKALADYTESKITEWIADGTIAALIAQFNL
jgi:putative glutamine transport system substrate-binding protein